MTTAGTARDLIGIPIIADPQTRDYADEQGRPFYPAALERGVRSERALPAGHRKRLRTTNGLERLNKQIKRRTRVATLFPNEASLLRLAFAVLSDKWETNKAHINMKAP